SHFRQYFTTVDKAELQSLPGVQGLGEDNRDQVIAVPCQLGSLDCGIVNELNRMPVCFHLLDSESPGQFEQHSPLAALAHLNLQDSLGVDLTGGLYLRADLVVGYRNRVEFAACSNRWVYRFRVPVRL